jgi:ComF family protein
VAAGVLDALLPPRCLACEGTAWDGALPGLCRRCGDGLARIACPCPRCGREAGAHAVVAPCPRCRDEHGNLDDLDGIIAPLRYTERARDLVLALKFKGRTPAARPLGLLLADAVEAARVPGDLVIAVPLSRRRLRQRGHNQADEIARVVVARTGLDRDAAALVRRRDTRPQSGLPRAHRAKNPRGAFRARRTRVEGRCVLLIDDVVTSGATAGACARALKRAGALRVVLAAACRA